MTALTIKFWSKGSIYNYDSDDIIVRLYMNVDGNDAGYLEKKMMVKNSQPIFDFSNCDEDVLENLKSWMDEDFGIDADKNKAEFFRIVSVIETGSDKPIVERGNPTNIKKIKASDRTPDQKAELKAWNKKVKLIKEYRAGIEY